jgi:hypothetical protein
MLEAILGNRTAEKVLLYIETYGEGYAQAIANTFDDVTLRMAQVQLARFERGGVLISQLKGRTRLYTWNPRYPFQSELRALRVDGKRPRGTVFVSDQQREVDFARSKGMFSLLIPWKGPPDFSALHGLDLIVFLKDRRFEGEAGVKVLQEIVGAQPRSLLAKIGRYGPMRHIVKVPSFTVEAVLC